MVGEVPTVLYGVIREGLFDTVISEQKPEHSSGLRYGQRAPEEAAAVLGPRQVFV